MDAARWKQVQCLFHEAADLSPDERQQLLEQKCKGDVELLREICGLLDGDARVSEVLSGGVTEAAGRMLGTETPLCFTAPELGPYRIVRLLGEGGMGVVYLAERDDLGNPVAIKFLRDAWMSPARRERFASEQRTLAQLNHPSIARLYDADTLSDGTPWFAMEYVEGLPLTEYCKSKNCSFDERLRLFRSVCEAVQYAHGQAVIHRDLKPSNILVKQDGGVRLLDFGISKQLGDDDRTVNQTRTAFRFLTPSYAAPEQIRGDPVGTRADVYSLGVILYELLAERLPLDPSKVGEIDPEKPSIAGKNLRRPRFADVSKPSWADLDVLCLTSMHKDPERRYGSVEALIRDIDHYLKGEPLEARPDSIRYRLTKFVKRNRRAMFASAASLAAIVALVIFFTVRLAKARNTALAQADRAQHIQKFMLGMFQGGDDDTAPANSMRVVTLLDRGVREARTLDREPEVQADLYQTLGAMYQDLGNFKKADALMRSALSKREELFGRDHPESAKSLLALGVLQVNQGKLEEAERLVREALEIDKRHLPAGNPQTANAMAGLGYVLSHRGSYADAIRELEEAAKLQSADPNANPELPDTLNSLAVSYFYAGHYEVSDALNRRVVDIYRQRYGDRYPLLADPLINLGASELTKGHFRDAERFYRQALDINRQWYGPEHPETAACITLLAEVLIREKRYDEAEPMLNRALATEESVYGPVHSRIASTLNQLGLVALNRGNLAGAEIQFQRAAEIFRRTNGDHHYTVALALGNLARVFFQQKEYARAEQLQRDVIVRLTNALSPNHRRTGIAQIALGRTLLYERRFKDAETPLVAGYRILMDQASAPVEELREARNDLATTYDALNRPDQAQRFRAQLAQP